MIITNQDGNAIANMIGDAIIEVENGIYNYSMYFHISDYKVLLGRFYTFVGARKWLKRIEAAYLNGDLTFEVGLEEDLDDLDMTEVINWRSR